MEPTRAPSPLALSLARELSSRARAGRLVLPVLSAVAAEALASVDDDDSDARTLGALVQRDPSLAAHVLRVANSARYAPNEPIVSLTQAIGRLGQIALREIVVTVAVQGTVFKARGHEAYLDRQWQHAYATARFAKEIARARRASVEAAFLSGLLHDIGCPVALQGLLELARERNVTLGEADVLDAIELAHAEIGATLVERWKLPAWVRFAVELHHAPGLDGEGAGGASPLPGRTSAEVDLVRTVALADRLAEWLEESEGAGLPPGEQLAASLDLYEEDLAAVCSLAPRIASEARSAA